MELVVISGKGGTGKTTIATALSELAKDVIRVDCDVDAPNFYLFYQGKDIHNEDFFGGKKASINKFLCIECGKCEKVCKFDAIKNFNVEPFLCEGCGACTLVCHQNAITLEYEKTADIYLTELKQGIISRAKMEIGADASGKLITQLRINARRVNEKDKLIIIDGSPGIGCPVISSITGADMVLVVTEPTKSGLQDLSRVVGLCKYFGIFTMVCINKYDINEDITKEIEDFIKDNNLALVGKIPYDDIVIKSINELKPITFYKDSIAAKAIRNMWNNIKEYIKLKEE
ncbi:MinD superfamily P-loop ATPase, contains an inserted ferredoxin domain [Caloramator fervidus]|uniref:MinD superfamily P-loop ATPase, contains an inserted ferredoxin domain n=1 Tax=Caloramator fervidus TaxID=29344 RepID=A0A1H5TLA2_9CLOT|nr:ATP-binding protein [Caloramator fervidus]SEF63544.1 MinD superfamily P-loop ATPase, contains an inserted ferredoxin domain [Caloramator fervidus]